MLAFAGGMGRSHSGSWFWAGNSDGLTCCGSFDSWKVELAKVANFGVRGWTE